MRPPPLDRRGGVARRHRPGSFLVHFPIPGIFADAPTPLAGARPHPRADSLEPLSTMKMKLIAAAVLISSSALAADSNPLGLQLWSLRNQMQASVPAGMDLVRSFGFTVVESAGTYGLTPKEFRALADAHGLKIVCGHF